jgi:hypothetical protein
MSTHLRNIFPEFELQHFFGIKGFVVVVELQQFGGNCKKDTIGSSIYGRVFESYEIYIFSLRKKS